MAFFACVACCDKARRDMDMESVSDISEISFPTKTRSPIIQVAPKPTIIDMAMTKDKPPAKDGSAREGERVVKTRGESNPDSLVASVGAGGKIGNRKHHSSRGSGDIIYRSDDKTAGGSLEVSVSSAA